MKNRSEKCGTGGYGDSLSVLTAYLNGDLVQ
jgi:carboxypeptidase C (cathepsin A)